VVLSKYSRRERNRARKHQVEIARVMNSSAEVNGFERLRKKGCIRGLGCGTGEL
jgi:hypothetical protein